MWFEGGCGNVIFGQEWQNQPYTLVNTTLNSISNGIIRLTSGGDPQINVGTPPAFTSSTYKYVCARYRIISGGDAGLMEIYYGTAASGGLAESKKGFKALNSDGNWHVISIDMTVDRYTTGPFVPTTPQLWTGNTINELRVDYTSNSGITMELDYIIISDRPLVENTSADDSVLNLTPVADATYYAKRLAESLCLYTSAPCANIAIYAGKTWTGAVDNNWTTSGNWVPSGMPTNNHCVQSAAGSVTVNGNGTAKNITLTGTAGLTITSGNTLTVENVINTTGTSGTFLIQDSGSLVQTNNVTNLGNISAIRIAKPMKRYDFTYWSSPVAGQNLLTFSPLTLSDKFYSYNPSSGWVTHLNGAATMSVGLGYAIRAPQTFPINTTNIFTGSFIGVPNNGEITVPNFQGSTTVERWNLIGNPYPSAINMNLFLTDADNSEAGGTIYLWTHNTPPSSAIPGSSQYNYTADDYASYNLTGPVATAATNNPNDTTDADDNTSTLVNGYVASGEAFFIRGIKNSEEVAPIIGGPITIKFKNSMRIVGGNANFFKPGPTTPVENWETTGKHRFWINLTNNQGAFNQALIGYIENATDGLDRLYDGELFGGNYVTVYSILDQKKLTIQGKSLPFNNNDTVPLGYKTTISGNFTISLDHFDGLFEGQDIFIKDKLLNLVHNLKDSAYDFTSGIGTFENRFEIQYQQETLDVEMPHATPENIMVYKNSNASILIDAGLLELDEISIYDISGKLIYHSESINNSKISIDNLPETNQVLIVDVLTEEGYQKTQKLIF